MGWADSRGLGRALVSAGVWALVTVLVLVLSSGLPSTGVIQWDAFLGFALGLLPILMMSWTIVRAPLRPWPLVALLLGGVVVSTFFSWLGWLTLAVPFKVGLASAAGVLLGRQVAEAWWLAVVALLAILADIWSVFAGPTKVVLERAPSVLDYLLVHFPIWGLEGRGMGLGMSDLVFLALFTAGAAGAGLRPRAGFLAMALSLLLTVVVALAWKPALPALPLLALAFLAANAGGMLRLLRARGGRGARAV